MSDHNRMSRYSWREHKAWRPHVQNLFRLRFHLSTQHNFSWIISHYSIMQCDRVRIVID